MRILILIRVGWQAGEHQTYLNQIHLYAKLFPFCIYFSFVKTQVQSDCKAASFTDLNVFEWDIICQKINSTPSFLSWQLPQHSLSRKLWVYTLLDKVLGVEGICMIWTVPSHHLEGASNLMKEAIIQKAIPVHCGQCAQWRGPGRRVAPKRWDWSPGPFRSEILGHLLQSPSSLPLSILEKFMTE